MSRIGNKPIAIPEGVEVTLNGHELTVKGKNGELTRTLNQIIKLNISDDEIVCERPDDSKEARIQHGTRRNRFSLDNGRVSMIRTISPSFAMFFSSCAFSLVEYFIRFLYFLCCFWVAISTVIVLSILSETTFPTYCLRSLRSVMYILLWQNSSQLTYCANSA